MVSQQLGGDGVNFFSPISKVINRAAVGMGFRITLAQLHGYSVSTILLLLSIYLKTILKPFHLAIPVADLELTRTIYRDILGCEEGRTDTHWVDFNFFGHQLVLYQKDGLRKEAVSNPVDGKEVPAPHFGVVLSIEDWNRLAEGLKRLTIDFIIEPYIRFEGEVYDGGGHLTQKIQLFQERGPLFTLHFSLLIPNS
jgi:hypothetical protein